MSKPMLKLESADDELDVVVLKSGHVSISLTNVDISSDTLTATAIVLSPEDAKILAQYLA